MIIVPPITITDTNLTATNVAEADATAWSAVTAYVIGNTVMVTTPNIHTVYECILGHTNQSPVTDVDAETGIGTYWIRVSATNRWAMFTDQISDQTENATSIEVTITPTAIFNSVCLFNLVGAEVTVVVDDPVDGVVYTNTVPITDSSGVSDWYLYFFSPIVARSDIALLDLPPYSNADINITVSAPASTAKCGLCVVGFYKQLGVAQYGTSVGIIDYSRKELDTYGRPIILQRNYSKRATYDVLVQTSAIGSVQRTLGSLRTTPVVWIGDSEDEATIVYGYYRDFDITYRDILTSPATIDVEGLT